MGRCDITIPIGYRLVQWKVQDNSSVRAGETIASIAPAENKDDGPSNGTETAASTTAITSTAQLLHKRPSRRRRPVPTAVAEATEATSTSTSQDVGAAMNASGLDTSTSVTVDSGNCPPPPSQKLRCLTVEQGAASHSKDAAGERSSITTIGAPADGIVRIQQTAAAATAALGTAIVVGCIEACEHPTIIDGMCAVCGNIIETKVSNGEASNAPLDSVTRDTTTMNGTTSMSRMTVAGLNVTVSYDEGVRMAQQDTQRLQKLRKLSLVLDLDHTLVHATADPRAQQYSQRTDVRSLVLPVLAADVLQHLPQSAQSQPPPKQQVWYQRHFVKIRPHIKEFLESAMVNYELGVYTAGTRDYAEQITMLIARHIVGVQRDQVELQTLRHQVAFCKEKLLHQQKQKVEEGKHPSANKSTNGTKGPNMSVKHEEPPGQDDIGNGHASKVNGVEHVDPIESANPTKVDEEETVKKRKRVTFGETVETNKEEGTTEEFVQQLEAELKAAEQLETAAQEMRQKLFGSRIVSRTEVGDLGRDVKSLKRIFPCGGSMAAVIDDREDVWANAMDDTTSTRRRGEPPDNLLLVRPYHWTSFLGFADVNNASGTDFLRQSSVNGSETDEQLLWTLDIVSRLHQRYFSCDGKDRPTVPEILANMRYEVLAGCRIVLSGLVPLNQQALDPSGLRPLFVRYAECLGATLHSTVDDTTTHVVANKDGTDKIISARRYKNCRIVKASWLIECFWRLKRVDESGHSFGPATSRLPSAALPSSGNDSVPLVGNHVTDVSIVALPSAIPSDAPHVEDKDNNADLDDDDDDDDDDFAADLENEFLRDTTGE